MVDKIIPPSSQEEMEVLVEVVVVEVPEQEDQEILPLLVVHLIQFKDLLVVMDILHQVVLAEVVVAVVLSEQMELQVVVEMVEQDLLHA